MDKDKELLTDQIDEDEDLLNFELDDLTPEDGEEDLIIGDESEIIELTDRIDAKQGGKPDAIRKPATWDDEDSKDTAEIIRVKTAPRQVDEMAETLTDLDISVLSGEEESLIKKISDKTDSFEGDLAGILEDETSSGIETDRSEGADDSLFEVINKVEEDELAETITNLQVDDDVAVDVKAGEMGYEQPERSHDHESEKAASVPETALETIPGISESKIEEIITRVLHETVERVVRETVSEVAERVISESIEALKQSLDEHFD